MCGLGDKDRRQISPPPFIKLIITDKDTGDEVNVDQIDINSFVLVTELWSPDEQENLTLNQNISTGANPEAIQYNSNSNLEPSNREPNTTEGQELVESSSRSGKNARKENSDSDESIGDVPTRNLIGNLVVNPFKLLDERATKGIWFIMHDLSVRIEGTFKLKFLFVNLNTNSSVFNFSQPFQVYSAKKFPGVVDSSSLGKVFASQGVKIPSRRESKPGHLMFPPQ